MKNKLMRMVLNAAALQILVVGSAIAVCLQPNPKVCAEFFKSDAVFVGIVIETIPVPDKDGFYDGWVYRLRAKQVYRGPTQGVIEVYTANDSGRFPLENGETYLLFAITYAKQLTINC